MKNVLTGLAVGLSLLVGASHSVEAATVTLYDGGASGVTPDQYNVPEYSPSTPGLAFGNANLAFPFTPSATRNVNNVNSTSSNSIYAGYSNYTYVISGGGPAPGPPVNAEFPTLDRNAGYTINFGVNILSQSNVAAARSGFSILVNSSDVGSGVPASVELAFQNGRIFVQSSTTVNNNNASPVAADISNFNPVGVGLVNYSLQVSGSTFTLSADGTPVLSNSLRDYTSFGGFGFQAYQIPNQLSLGDNTTSANANFNLGAISVTTNNATPVPFGFHPTFGLFILGAWATSHHFKNQKK